VKVFRVLDTHKESLCFGNVQPAIALLISEVADYLITDLFAIY